MVGFPVRSSLEAVNASLDFSHIGQRGSQNRAGMKHTAPRKKTSNARGTSTRPRKPVAAGHRFAVCVQNDGYEASLERNKIYVVLPDRDADRDGELRVVSKRPSQKPQSDTPGGSATPL